MKKILFITDMSRGHDAALKYAFDYTKKYNAEMNVLYVGGLSASHRRKYFREDEVLYEQTKQLDIWVNRILKHTNQVNIVVEQGMVLHTVKEYVNESNMDMVMVPRRAVVNTLDLIFGSRIHLILKSLDVPVMIIPPQSIDAGHSNILAIREHTFVDHILQDSNMFANDIKVSYRFWSNLKELKFAGIFNVLNPKWRLRSKQLIHEELTRSSSSVLVMEWPDQSEWYYKIAYFMVFCVDVPMYILPKRFIGRSRRYFKDMKQISPLVQL